MTVKKQPQDKKVIPGNIIAINAIESCMDIPDCMTAEETRSVTTEDEHLSMLSD